MLSCIYWLHHYAEPLTHVFTKQKQKYFLVEKCSKLSVNYFPRKNSIYVNYIYITLNIVWLNVHYDCKLSDRNKTKENTRKYSHLSIAQPLIGDKRIIRNKNEICLRQKEFKLSNFIQEFSIEVSIAIALKGLVKRVRQNKRLTVGCIEFDLWSIRVNKNQLYMQENINAVDT